MSIALPTHSELPALLAGYPAADVRDALASTTPARVEAALGHETRTPADLIALLSPAAEAYLEPMAREAQRLTRWHFGRTISLYAPLYISNLCAADCVYCGFSVRAETNDKRVTLKPEHIHAECAALRQQGFDAVLILTGEAPRAVPPSYIRDAVAIANEYFSSVAVEIYSVDTAAYRSFVEAGLEGVTLYMETYDRDTYRAVHREGEKADYDYRLDALTRAGRAGVRRLSLGALLGLFDWRVESLHTALHARWLQRHCWQSAVAVSFPRLLHVPARYQVANPVTDAELVQAMLALRLFLPEAGFNLSTRERPALRDRLIPLGVTHMSAGSSTQPGGYAVYPRGGEQATTRERDVLEQFALEDLRAPDEVVAAIRRAGYDPVWKDYDRGFDRG